MSKYKFAFVIDGEFAVAASCGGDPLPSHCEALVAAFRSNPQIVEIMEDDPLYAEIKEGWRYVDGAWLPPAEPTYQAPPPPE